MSLADFGDAVFQADLFFKHCASFREEVMCIKTVTTYNAAEAKRLIANGYVLDSIAYFVSNPICCYTLSKR